MSEKVEIQSDLILSKDGHEIDLTFIGQMLIIRPRNVTAFIDFVSLLFRIRYRFGIYFPMVAFHHIAPVKVYLQVGQLKVKLPAIILRHLIK
jgi:hypothetical protein